MKVVRFEWGFIYSWSSVLHQCFMPYKQRALFFVILTDDSLQFIHVTIAGVCIYLWHSVCDRYSSSFFVCARSMWQRAGAVRLFVEHVTLFDEQDDNANSESVVRLWKVLITVSTVSTGICKLRRRRWSMHAVEDTTYSSTMLLAS